MRFSYDFFKDLALGTLVALSDFPHLEIFPFLETLVKNCIAFSFSPQA